MESVGRVVSRGGVVTSLDSIEAGRWSAAALVDGYDSRGPVPAMEQVGRTVDAAAQAAVAQKALNETIASREQLIGTIDPPLQNEIGRTQSELAAASHSLSILPPPQTVFAAASQFAPMGFHVPPPEGKPRPIHVLFRGNLSDPRELAKPRAVTFLPRAREDFELGPS